jgi:hypothetical protein
MEAKTEFGSLKQREKGCVSGGPGAVVPLGLK